MVILIFDPWLFKISCEAPPEKSKGEKIELPGEPWVYLGLVDLELEDIEVFLPPPLWDDVSKSIVKIEYQPRDRG